MTPPAHDGPRFVLRGPFHNHARAGSPAVGDEAPALRIAVADLAREGSLARFTLLVTCGLPDALFHAYNDLFRAVVVELQDAGAGEGAAFALVDPTINALDPPIRNFTPAPAGARSVAFVRAYTAVPFEATLAAGPGLFVRATLQGWRSNTVHIPAESP